MVGVVYLIDELISGECWLRTKKCIGSGLQLGWKGKGPSEEEECKSRASLRTFQISPAVCLDRCHSSRQRRAVDVPCHLAQTYEVAQYRAFVRPESQHSANTQAIEPASNNFECRERQERAAELSSCQQHGSRTSFQHFKSRERRERAAGLGSSSPILVATIRRVFGFVYSYTYDIDNDNALGRTSHKG